MCVCVSVRLTSVISREAAAALMCKLGCLTELLQSNARANVPTALATPFTEGVTEQGSLKVLHTCFPLLNHLDQRGAN